MLLNSILLDAAAQPANSGLMSWGMILLLVVIFYFFLIRPQSKKNKEIKKFRDGMAKGDKVVTAGGIYGRICGIKDDKLVLEIADNVKITIDKASVYPTAQDAAESAANAADK